MRFKIYEANSLGRNTLFSTFHKSFFGTFCFQLLSSHRTKMSDIDEEFIIDSPIHGKFDCVKCLPVLLSSNMYNSDFNSKMTVIQCFKNDGRKKVMMDLTIPVSKSILNLKDFLIHQDYTTIWLIETFAGKPNVKIIFDDEFYQAMEKENIIPA
jgi:hypothetical protein